MIRKLFIYMLAIIYFILFNSFKTTKNEVSVNSNTISNSNIVSNSNILSNRVSNVTSNKPSNSNNTSNIVKTSNVVKKSNINNSKKNNYVSYNGNLSVKGTKIVNQYGEKIILKGVSSHGLQWFNYLVTDQNIKTLKSWNSNVFRLAMYTKEGGYIDNKNIYNDLIKDIDLVIKNDMYVIVDWHILSDNNPNTYKKEAIEFFNKISSKYKNTPNIIYEICNEPNGNTSWSDVKSYATDVVKTIRKNSNNIIIVGTPTWSQDVDKVINNKINDKNTMYSLHFYSGTHKEYLRDKAKKALNNNVPIFITEYGVSDASGNGGVYLDEANKWMKFIKNNDLSFVNWSLADKNESSALLKQNNRVIKDSSLSASGKYIKNILKNN